VKLKDQVCSFALAIKLKELGVEQLGLFSWYKVKESSGGIKFEVMDDMYAADVCSGGVEMVCSAFTVAELGEMLPEGIKATMSHLIPKYKHENGEEISFYLYMKKQMRYKGWTYYYVEEFNHEGNGVQINNSSGNYDKNEANARAKMFVYLLENKLLRRGNDTTRF